MSEEPRVMPPAWEQTALRTWGWIGIVGGVCWALYLMAQYVEPSYADDLARVTANLRRITDGGPSPRFVHNVMAIAWGASVSFGGWLLLKFADALEYLGELRARLLPQDKGPGSA